VNLRLRDSSIRVRLSLEEVEALRAAGRVERETHVPGGSAAFRYAVAVDERAAETFVRLAPFELEVVLASADLSYIADPSRDGVSLRRAWTDREGRPRRGLIVVEKDRMGEKPSDDESWIYDRS
jgi:hypothetical protein